MSNMQDEELRYELQKLFIKYSVGVSAGMSATRPKTVEDAEAHTQACIELAMQLIKADREAAIREAEKSQGNTSCPNCEQVIEYCDLCGSRLEPLNQPTKEGE